MRLIQVAVPVPQLDALTYAVPPEFPDPHPGARVLVPLGRRTLTGVVLNTCAPRLEPPATHERDMLEFALDAQPTSRLSCQIKVDESLDGLVVSVPGE